jgi:PAP2 superfamily
VSAPVDTSLVEAPPSARRFRGPWSWLREALVIGAVYVVYGFVRNLFGSARLKPGDAPLHAFNNAVHIIDVEKALGLFHEQTIQRWFLGTPWETFFNFFYGTAHFVVTLGVLIWLFVRHREDFGRWRTTLMATTVLALIGFALFPLMPPRLFNTLPSVNRYGGGELAIEHHQPDYGFVDTLREGNGLWSFDSSKMDQLSNQYAAMPSLHIGWSLWCAIVIAVFARRRYLRWLGLLYPILTLLAIVATANHYIIDAAGGIAIVVAGFLIALGIEHLRRKPPQPVEAEVNGDVLVPS